MGETRIPGIDDEPPFYRFLKPALEAAGYRVERANSGTEGFRLATTRNPTMILLDLGLPNWYGQDVLVRLRAVSPVPAIVVAARTATAAAAIGTERGVWYRMAESETMSGPSIPAMLYADSNPH